MKIIKLAGFVAFTGLLTLNFGYTQEFDLNQRVNSSVTASSGAGLFMIVDRRDGKEVIDRVGELPRGARFTFEPGHRIERPLVIRDSGEATASPGGYYGSIEVDMSSLSRRERNAIGQIETSDLYIYEWSVDKSSYLRQVFDIAPLDKRFTSIESFDWDRISTKGLWTTEAARLVQTYGDALLYDPPSDVTDFCPTYHNLNIEGKTSFWIHLLNSIARRESAFDPMVGNDESSFGNNNQGVVSRGLMQISYGSIGRPYRNAGCDVRSASELHNPIANIQCGVAIFNHWVDRDGCISCRDGSSWRGIARYWSTVRERYTVSCSVCSSGEASIGYKDQIIEEIQEKKICQGALQQEEPAEEEPSRIRRFFNRLR